MGYYHCRSFKVVAVVLLSTGRRDAVSRLLNQDTRPHLLPVLSPAVRKHIVCQCFSHVFALYNTCCSKLNVSQLFTLLLWLKSTFRLYDKNYDVLYFLFCMCLFHCALRFICCITSDVIKKLALVVNVKIRTRQAEI